MINTTTLKARIVNSMINDVINKFGVANPITIKFCEIAVDCNNFTLIKKYYQKLCN